jgi:hypothetical protein
VQPCGPPRRFFRFILASFYLQNPRSEQCSYPFSDSFSPTLGEKQPLGLVFTSDLPLVDARRFGRLREDANTILGDLWHENFFVPRG